MKDEIRDAVIAIIDRDRTRSHINPSWVAHQVMLKLDPKRISPPSVYGGANLWARHVAREKLRGKFLSGDVSAQDELFPELQWRYPVAHCEKRDDPEYVLRDLMTDEDIAWNVDRLRAEAEAKLRHADALEDFGKRRRSVA